MYLYMRMHKCEEASKSLLKTLLPMDKNTYILGFNNRDGISIEVYLQPDTTYKIHRSELVSPWPDDMSFREALKTERQELAGGIRIYMDAWETSNVECHTWQDVIKELNKQAPKLTDFNPILISDDYKDKLRQLINITSDSGEYSEAWKNELNC